MQCVKSRSLLESNVKFHLSSPLKGKRTSQRARQEKTLARTPLHAGQTTWRNTIQRNSNATSLWLSSIFMSIHLSALVSTNLPFSPKRFVHKIFRRKPRRVREMKNFRLVVVQDEINNVNVSHYLRLLNILPSRQMNNNSFRLFIIIRRLRAPFASCLE